MSESDRHKRASDFDEKDRRIILQKIDDERKIEQKANEEIRDYLSDKRVHSYRGNRFYKATDYKHGFYVDADILENLGNHVKEVDLKRTGYAQKHVIKGLIKWDSARKKVLISPSKVRVYYKPFEIER